LTAQTRARLRELAYSNIQDLIATRKLKPGEYINERALSNDIGIGRTPTRQALERLTLDKLIQFIPGRGSIVRPIGPQELLQIAEARIVNEELSARLAARHATEIDIAELDGILDRAQHWTPRRNIERLLLLDRAFHAVLSRIAGNAFILEILPGLHERFLGYWFTALNLPGRLQEIAEEHTSIVRAIKQHDEAGAAKAMSHHIRLLHRAMLEAFSTGTDHAGLNRAEHNIP
jgi:DNA-binding GntR family transcriptional regulator